MFKIQFSSILKMTISRRLSNIIPPFFAGLMAQYYRGTMIDG